MQEETHILLMVTLPVAVDIYALRTNFLLCNETRSDWRHVPLGADPGADVVPLVAEERVSMGLHVASSSTTRVADIRSTYNEVDSRLIAKEVHLLTSLVPFRNHDLRAAFSF